MDKSTAAVVASFSDAIRATCQPVLLELGEDRSGFLDTVLRTGEVVYERSESESESAGEVPRPG